MTDNGDDCQIVQWSDGWPQTWIREAQNKHDIGSKMQGYNERRRRRRKSCHYTLSRTWVIQYSIEMVNG